jgi:hypothetical protein
MALTFEQTIMLFLVAISAGQFVVLLLLYWHLIIMPNPKRKNTSDKRWL